METTNLNIRIDKDLKARADKVFNELGMNLTTAVTVFVRQAVREGKIPFEISLRATGADGDAAERGRAALRGLRAEAAERGFLSDADIESEIRAAKSGLNTQADFRGERS
jgi:addiction module RelB/DinJ family antitoxin